MIFSRALRPRTMGNGKTIERQARGSLSLLNNFCVLKFNRTVRRSHIEDAFVVHVVGRGDTISVPAAGIRSNVEFPFSRLRWHKRPGNNYFARGIYGSPLARPVPLVKFSIRNLERDVRAMCMRWYYRYKQMRKVRRSAIKTIRCNSDIS